MFRETHRVEVSPADFLPFVGTGENRYLGGVAEKHDVRLDLERDKARTYAIYLEIIRGRLGPLPGAREFIAACRARGWKLAVATSADRVKLDGNLREIGIPPSTFDACVTGSEVERKKPDPQIFLVAAERIGLPASACVVVEDAVSGVRAGRAAGARVLGLTTSYPESALRDAGAEWIAQDLSEFSPKRFG